MFSAGRAVLTLIALLAAGCGMQEEVTKPVFLEARMKETQSGIEAVFLAATASRSECEARTALMIFSRCPTCKFTKASCSDSLPTRFQGVWDGKPYRATYLHLTHGIEGERDGRLIFFSVPSSVVSGACPVIESKIRETYKGTIECRKGTVG
jgi:hypothetical protein